MTIRKFSIIAGAIILAALAVTFCVKFVLKDARVPGLHFAQSVSGASHGSLKFNGYAITPGLRYSYGFATADFNQDGNLDVVYADSWVAQRDIVNPVPKAQVYLRSVNGSSELIASLDRSFSQSPVDDRLLIERMIVLDVNGDGWLDVASAVNSHDSVMAFINPGRQGGKWRPQLLSNGVPGAVNLLAADVDGDGRQEIVVSMRQQQAVFPEATPGIGFLKSNRSGTEWQFHPIDIGQQLEPRTLQFGDIDGDGKPELVTSDQSDGKFYVYHPDIDQPWKREVAAGISAKDSAYNLLHDVNGDGRLEFVYGAPDGIYYADFSNGIQKPIISKITGFHSVKNAKVGEIATGDVDGDGVDELVFCRLDGGVFWIDRSKDGSWSSHWVTSSNARFVAVQVADYDNDGKNDVLADIEYDLNLITLYHNVTPADPE